jgi:ssDNA thymidine ADP-ribosyltransferase, DarT/HD domain
MPEIAQILNDRYCFHFTHMKNLGSIIENGLFCTNLKEKSKIKHFNVASEGIQLRRSRMEVTCGPKGVVHDYVPFYLTAKNPMFLRLLNTKNVDQQDMVILAIPLKGLLGKNTVFTDASANTEVEPNFYTDEKDLTQLNWTEIDSKAWSSKTDELRHQKMAEVLVHGKVEMSQVEYVIVFNEHYRDKVKEVFAEKKQPLPKFSYLDFKGIYFYYTKFTVKGKERQSLITGPRTLRAKFKLLVKELEKKHAEKREGKYRFANLSAALSAVEDNFCAIKELEGIHKLKTDNKVHKENVSDHTLKVVSNLLGVDYYKILPGEDKMILEFSAYLHDIGKGPASKWAGGIQPSYPDHPADGVEMLYRILNEDIKTLSPYQIRTVSLLVVYHDLIGEIMFKDRGRQQLLDVVSSKKELKMLAALNGADIKALNPAWTFNYKRDINTFVRGVIDEMELA